jgi:ABC-type branched-subunit amino acid transport system permease subunit
MDQMAFNSQSFSGGLGGVFFNRPGFVTSALSYYFATLIIFGIFALLVTNIRRGKTGLSLTAMRDSQVAVASTGASVTRLKFVAFCVSAFIAAFGGALYAGAQNLAQPTNFFELQSLLFLALAVIGGINRWTGALIGATLYLLAQPAFELPAIQNSFVGHLFNGQLPDLLPVFFGLGAIGLAQNPHGVIEQVREGFLRFRDRFQDVAARGQQTAQAPKAAEAAA